MSGRPPPRPITRLLIANRGEIAARILSTCRELEIETYCLYTADDASHCLSLHTSHCIQLSSPAAYLDVTELLGIVKKYKIDAVHPGYGFLSESAAFAQSLWENAECTVVGPGWDVLARTGDKLAAKQLAETCHVPTLPATQTPTDNFDEVLAFAKSVGFPVIVKAVDGGGGRGIRIVREESSLRNLLERALKESPLGKVFVEKAAIDGFRHVEVQIVGDSHGNVRHLWERECSIQRRFQKVVEFAPSSIKDRALVAEVIEAALRMAKKVDYMSLGTFEFLVRPSPPEFYFLEVNPRIQVEHTITESICVGVDLVRIQLQIATGQRIRDIINLPDDPKTPPLLHSIQLRVTAEDASQDWSLSVGKISSSKVPSGNGVRIDTHMSSLQPTIVRTDFDSLLAKVIVTSETWHDVVAKAKRALADTKIMGVKTSLPALTGIIFSQQFLEQKCDIQWLERSMVQVLQQGQGITSRLENVPTLALAMKSPTVSVSGAPANVMLRKGDAWSVTLDLPSQENKPQGASPTAGHLQLTRVLRNEFPQQLSASITYTPPSGQPMNYTMSMSATNASAGALASTNKHRRGDPNNNSHIIIPFPGQLMEILVEVDDLIMRGDVLAVVRQMKMELEIRAKKSGRVIWAFEGEEGEEVGEGLLIAEIEEDSSGAPKL